MDGRILTCCRNPTGFGNWIENGVDGTWNAPEFVRFREKIIAGEYPDEFCELCDSNGTALSLRQLLERALDEYVAMAWSAGANGAEDYRDDPLDFGQDRARCRFPSDHRQSHRPSVPVATGHQQGWTSSLFFALRREAREDNHRGAGLC